MKSWSSLPFFFASHFLRLCGASNNARAIYGLGLGQDGTDGMAISDKIMGSIGMPQDICIEVELWGEQDLLQSHECLRVRVCDHGTMQDFLVERKKSTRCLGVDGL